MECPKCGAARQAGSVECSSCGIIFARWQKRPERAPAALPSNPVESVPVRAPDRAPPWMILAGVIAILAFGAIWTGRRRAARSEGQPDLLNEINNRQVKSQQRLRAQMAEEVANVKRHTPLPQTAPPPVRPPDPDEDLFQQVIENCRYFRDDAILDIPFSFERQEYTSMKIRYPALEAAAREHLIEFDPPLDSDAFASVRPRAQPSDIISVKLGPSTHSKVDVFVRAETFQFSLGKRHITSMRVERTGETEAAVHFDWKYDRPIGHSLTPEGRETKGEAYLTRTPGGWSVTRAWVEGTSSKAICP